jgi:hypothetical protein
MLDTQMWLRLAIQFLQKWQIHHQATMYGQDALAIATPDLESFKLNFPKTNLLTSMRSINVQKWLQFCWWWLEIQQYYTLHKDKSRWMLLACVGARGAMDIAQACHDPPKIILDFLLLYISLVSSYALASWNYGRSYGSNMMPMLEPII